MVSQSVFNTNQPNNTISVAKWWDQIRLYADRFFYLAHSFEATADERITAALMANLIDMHECVEEMAFPAAATKARSRLLDAMAQTMMGIGSVNDDGSSHSHLYFEAARHQLKGVEAALDQHII